MSHADLTADEQAVLSVGGFTHRTLFLVVCKILRWQVVVVVVVAAVVKAEAAVAEDWASPIPLQNVEAEGVGAEEYSIHIQKALCPP